MEIRLHKLKEFISKLKDDCYAEQYGIADFVQGDDVLEKKLENLSKEAYLYKRFLKDLEKINFK